MSHSLTWSWTQTVSSHLLNISNMFLCTTGFLQVQYGDFIWEKIPCFESLLCPSLAWDLLYNKNGLELLTVSSKYWDYRWAHHTRWETVLWTQSQMQAEVLSLLETWRFNQPAPDSVPGSDSSHIAQLDCAHSHWGQEFSRMCSGYVLWRKFWFSGISMVAEVLCFLAAVLCSVEQGIWS